MNHNIFAIVYLIQYYSFIIWFHVQCSNICKMNIKFITNLYISILSHCYKILNIMRINFNKKKIWKRNIRTGRLTDKKMALQIFHSDNEWHVIRSFMTWYLNNVDYTLVKLIVNKNIPLFSESHWVYPWFQYGRQGMIVSLWYIQLICA